MKGNADARRIGRRIVWFEQVESTNSVAASHAHDTANDGLVIIAERQTAGRGRHGRNWLSPPGEGLLLSVLLFPPEELRRPALLTALAAAAVCNAVEECANLSAIIKWPNDVLVHGKKVCGILVEQGRGLVIGIGLNVNTPAAVFAEAGLPHAGSLALFAGKPLDRELVLEGLLNQLDAHYRKLLNDEPMELEAQWRRHTGLLGSQVKVRTHAAEFQGRIVELTFTAIVLQESSGNLHHFVPEIIEHIAPLDRRPT